MSEHFVSREGLDESHFEGEAFVDVGVEVALQLAEDADALGDIGGAPFLREGGGGFLIEREVQMLRAGLLAGDIAKPSEQQIHQGAALLDVVRFDGSLDLLVIDAFTGDSVPTHLLTREAFALYGRKLTADGVLALHVSNKYLDFVPVVEAVAADGDWMGLVGRDVAVGADAARIPSEWIALSRSLDAVKAIYSRPTSDQWKWRPCAETTARDPWTDDRTAVIEALR